MLRQIKSDRAIFLRRKRRNRFNLARNNKRSLPRLTVFRSNVHIYAQIIDDINQKVLAEASTVGKEMNSLLKKKTSNIEAAKIVGKKIAERALAVNIKEVVFDRGGYIFHGRVKALADTVRENGLKL